MDDMLKDFVDEAKELTDQLTEILEVVEGEPGKYKEFERFGQIVDRLMGGAKLCALDHPQDHPVHTIANFTELCKIIGYKASQVSGNEQLATTVASFLLDATETLCALYDRCETGTKGNLNEVLTATFLDRLQWLATKFDESLRPTVAISKASANSTQSDIDSILKQMGLNSL